MSRRGESWLNQLWTIFSVKNGCIPPVICSQKLSRHQERKGNNLLRWLNLHNQKPVVSSSRATTSSARRYGALVPVALASVSRVSWELMNHECWCFSVRLGVIWLNGYRWYGRSIIKRVWRDGWWDERDARVKIYHHFFSVRSRRGS